MLQDNKTILWINNAKAICMLLVYYFHTEWYVGICYPFLDNLYTPFFTNCFFFISGYLIYKKQLSLPLINESYRNFVSRDGGGRVLLNNLIFRIAIPSVLFAFLQFVPKKILRGTTFELNDLLFETIGGCTYWFTSALVIAELMLLIILMTRIKKLYVYVLFSFLIASIGVFFINNSIPVQFDGVNENFPWCYKKGMVAMVYIAIGGLYWKYEDRINILCSKVSNIIVISLLGAVYVGLVLLVNCLTDSTMQTVTAFVRNGIGILLIIRICMIIRKSSIMSFIGRNSIGFYFLSGALPNTYGIIFNLIFNDPVLLLLITLIFSVITAYFIIVLVNKYCPWLFDLRKLSISKMQ